MQITIVQTEIEQAIENYVKSMISVNDDQKISIDLKATRGDTGMQAFIDIVPRTGAKRVLAASTAGSVAAATPVKTETKPVVQEQVQEVVEEVQEEEQPQAEEAAPVKKGVEIEVDDEGNPVKPAGAPKSIFGNLKKPVNEDA